MIRAAESNKNYEVLTKLREGGVIFSFTNRRLALIKVNDFHFNLHRKEVD